MKYQVYNSNTHDSTLIDARDADAALITYINKSEGDGFWESGMSFVPVDPDTGPWDYAVDELGTDDAGTETTYFEVVESRVV